MDGWVIFLIIILVVLVILVIIFLVWFFSHSDKQGQVCTTQSECSTGLVCVNTGTIPAPTYTCRAGFHTPCTGGSASTICAPGLTCGTSSICIPLPQTPTPPATGSSTAAANRGAVNKAGPAPHRPRPSWLAPRLHPHAHQANPTAAVNPTVLVTGQPALMANTDDASEMSVSESGASFDSIGEEGHIDMCSFSNMTLALNADGRIVAQSAGAASRYVNNNVQLQRIFSYNSYLTGLTVDGIIVYLDQDQVTGNNWVWKRYANMPDHITSCSVTLNQKYLWLHNSASRHGYLYSGSNMIEQKDRYSLRRAYGLDKDTYIEIDDDRRTALVQPTGQQFTDVYDAAIAYPDKISILRHDQRSLYRGIAIVNWQAMYIKA